MTTTQQKTPAVRAMYAGLALTVVATIVPFVDRATTHLLADHIRAGYPAYPQGRIDTAVSTWLGILAVVGALGVAGWIWSIRAVAAGKRWARWTATALLALGTTVALTALLIRDTSGDTGLPALIGALGILPCGAGAVAVTMLWRGSAHALRGAAG
jgi:hypothetical protein